MARSTLRSHGRITENLTERERQHAECEFSTTTGPLSHKGVCKSYVSVSRNQGEIRRGTRPRWITTAMHTQTQTKYVPYTHKERNCTRAVEQARTMRHAYNETCTNTCTYTWLYSTIYMSTYHISTHRAVWTWCSDGARWSGGRQWTVDGGERIIQCGHEGYIILHPLPIEQGMMYGTTKPPCCPPRRHGTYETTHEQPAIRHRKWSTTLGPHRAPPTPPPRTSKNDASAPAPVSFADTAHRSRWTDTLNTHGWTYVDPPQSSRYPPLRTRGVRASARSAAPLASARRMEAMRVRGVLWARSSGAAAARTVVAAPCWVDFR